MKIAVEAEDKNAGKILEKIMNDEYPKHREFIEALLSARMHILLVYGLETPQNIWDRIGDAYMKKVIELESAGDKAA